MTRLLALGLACSLALNVWLLASRRGSPDLPPPVPPAVREVPSGESDVPPVPEEAPSRDPSPEAVRRPDPLGLREIASIPSSEERRKRAWRLAEDLARDPAAVAAVLAALRSETDAAVLAVIGTMFRAALARGAGPEIRDGLLDVLRHGDLPERRAAAVWGLWWICEGRSDRDPECVPALVDAVRADPSPAVAGAIGEMMATFLPPPEAVEALREALVRLPAGPDRRAVAEALGRGTFLLDGGAELVRRMEEAGESALKDDLAAGLARAASSMSAIVRRDEAPADREAREQAARARLLTAFRNCPDPEIRRKLARGVPSGFGFSWFGSWRAPARAPAAGLYRDLAAAEPDADLRDRLLRVAAEIEAGGVRGTDELCEILGLR